MKLITHLLRKGLVLSGLALFSYSTLIAQTTTDPESPPPFKRIYHEGELGIIQGNSDGNEGSAFALNVINGYRFSGQLSAGLGIGWQNYDEMDVMPIFLRLSGSLKSSGSTPYVFADTGYGWAWIEDTPEFVRILEENGGVYFRPGIGYSISINNWSLNIFTAWLMQKSSYRYTYDDGWGPDNSEVSEERTRKRFTAGISVRF